MKITIKSDTGKNDCFNKEKVKKTDWLFREINVIITSILKAYTFTYSACSAHIRHQETHQTKQRKFHRRNEVDSTCILSITTIKLR